MGNKNRLPDALNVDQLVKIFDSINSPKTGIAAFVAFFCGLRIDEVCKLKVENIDLKNRQLKIVDSKNTNRSATGYGKDRYVPIPRKVMGPIQKWLEIIGSDSKWFLPSMSSPDRPLRKKSLYEQFKEGLNRANLSIPLYTFGECKGRRKGMPKTKYKYYFHTLRHSYATYLLGKGVDIYTISNLLGHNQVTTTQIYARINVTQQREAVEDAFDSPLMEFRPNYKQHVIQQPIQQPQQNESLERLRLEVERTKLEIEKMKLQQMMIVQTH